MLEVWLVSPRNCPKCSLTPMPWSCKLRLHKACILSWAEARLTSTRRNMEEAEVEIFYEVIYKDNNCQIEVEKKTMRSPPPGRLSERGSVRLDGGGVKRRKRKLSKSTEQAVEQVVHGEKKFEPAQDLGQILKSNTTNESLLDPTDIEKKMKMIQAEADAPEKEIPCPPPDRLREMIVALGRQEDMIAEIKNELKKIHQRKRKVEEKERDCVEEMDEVKRELESLQRIMKKK